MGHFLQNAWKSHKELQGLSKHKLQIPQQSKLNCDDTQISGTAPSVELHCINGKKLLTHRKLFT